MSYFAKFVNVARYEATLRKVLFLKHTEISKTQYFSYVIKKLRPVSGRRYKIFA